MNKVHLDVNKAKHQISKYIYGHFAEHLGRCIYDGIYVGEASTIPNIEGMRIDVIDALKELKVPVLRWPGGCFADEYHWEDGIGPKDKRKKSMNTFWGMVTETHKFGTHEFFKLCELLECDPYVAGNMGSGTVLEMQNWVDYISNKKETTMSNLRVKNGQKEPWKLPFFGIGNESWACGGNMRPSYYADLYRQYSSYVKNYPGNSIRKIACGPDSADYKWTDEVMEIAGKYMWGLSLHYYTRTFNTFDVMGHATDFEEDEYINIMKYTYLMDEYITKHSQIMDKYDKEKKVALVVDEWGTWYKAKAGTNKRFYYQQNTIRDAISASMHFNFFHKHCERVKMANLAQVVNVIQSVILTDGDVMIKTPTYHVFNMYKVHQDNIMIPLFEKTEKYNELPKISSTASINEETNTIYYSVCNIDTKNNATISVDLENINEISAKYIYGEKINSHNTKDDLKNVDLLEFTDYEYNKDGLIINLPPLSVSTFTIKL